MNLVFTNPVIAAMEKRLARMQSKLCRGAYHSRRRHEKAESRWWRLRRKTWQLAATNGGKGP